jgi:hypothetical protein
MVLNIIPLFQFDKNLNERKISLMTNNKKIIISLCYLHEELTKDTEQNIRSFKIEIPESKTMEIGAMAEEKLIAIPALEITKTQQTKKDSSYEVNI